MENKWTLPKNKKKLSVLILVALVILFWVGFGAFYKLDWNQTLFQKIVNIFSSDQIFNILWFDESNNKKKVPMDANSFDFTFSQNLDESSLTKENFKITPFIDWELKLINWNTIQYVLWEKLKDWQNFSVSISKNIKSEKWKKLDKNYNFEIEVVSQVKVIKINPEWNLENLYQNIAVFFNVPMVPFTNLDNRDKLPCPITITPKVEWTCKWTTTSVLEFVPSTHFQWSTNYEVEIVNVSGLNYPISEQKKITITTPKLNAYINNKFDPKRWIDLVFNFPVDLKQLQEKIILTVDWKQKNVKINQNSWSESIFNLKLVWEEFIYSKNYDITILEWLMPKYGNISMWKISKLINSYDFLWWVDIYQNIYSQTWQLINTKSSYYRLSNNYWYWYGYDGDDRFLPVKNLFFQVNFQEDVSLDKSNFAFISQDWKKIDFNIEYIKEEVVNKEQTQRKIVDNKKSIKLTLKSNLDYNKTYKLTVYKKISSNVEKDIVKEYKTSPKFSVLDFKFVSYNLSCLYLSNQISSYNDYEEYDDEQIFRNITTYPKARIADVYNIFYYWWDHRYSECPKPKNWQFLYSLDTRLNPYSSYNILVSSWLKDNYWNKLDKDYSWSVKTQWIQEQDKYLYSSNNYKSLIPSDLDLVVNLQTVNLDNVQFQACQMDLQWYFDFLKYQQENSYNYYDNYGYENSYDYWYVSWEVQKLSFCKKDVTKTLKVKNKYWAVSNNKFDLEKDIFWSKFSDNFVYVRWSFYWFKDFHKQDYSKKFENIYIRSNLAMVLEKWENKNILMITSIDGKQNLKDLKLSFYKDDWKKISIINVKYNYNSEKWTYEFENDKNIRFIVAQKSNYFGILDIQSDALSNYDFKYIAWEPTSLKDYLYLYTDRPLYKPWDTVYFKWLLRKFNFDWYKKSDIKLWKLQVMDENWKVLKEVEIKLDENSNFNWEFVLPNDIWLGRFGFKFQIDKKYLPKDQEYYSDYVPNNAYFYVEEYVKPTFKVDTTVDRKDFSIGENTTINIEPKYYFGGKMINTKWTYSIISQNYFFDAKDYSDYQFWEWYEYFNCLYRGSCSYRDQYHESNEFNIDENWTYTFKYLFPEQDYQKNLLWEKIYSFNFEVIDPDTKRTVSKTVSQVVHNTDWYVWLQIPYRNDISKWIDFAWIVLDREANPKKADIDIQIIKQERQSVKKEWLNWVFYSEYSMKETLVEELVLTSNEKWEIAKNIEIKSAWEYLIKAAYKWKNWKEFVSSQNVYVGGWWDSYFRNVDNNSITELVAEKNILNVWDTQKFMLKSPVDNWKALFVIEKDDGILDYFIHEIKSNSDTISVPVKNTYYPNFYVKVFLLWTQKNNPLPVYKRALAITKVNTEYKNLKVDVMTDKSNYLPWEKVKITINVTDNSWKSVGNVNGSIAVVDQSLLALKWNPIKNPYAFFYDMKRYLGITTYSPFAYLIEKLEIKDSSDWSKWWDGPQLKWWNSNKKRWTFKDTAFWYADFTTNEYWVYEFTTDKLPDNLTTRVVEALVNTPSDNKIWVSTTTFETNKKLMISDNLPQVFWSLDQISLSPVIFNKIWKDWEFEISLTATNAKVQNSTQKISIKNWEQKTVYFTLKIDDIGINVDKNNLLSEINIKAKSLNTNDEDRIQKFVQIKETSTPEFVATVWKTSDVSYDEKIQIWDVLSNAGVLKINYWASLFTSLLDWIDYLQNYPYGCLEQKISSIMPNIYIKKLYNSAWKEFDLKKKMIKYWDGEYEWYKEISVDETIKNFLVDIQKFQNSDWWFVYRYDVSRYPNYSNFGLTNYVVQSLSEIKSLWYKVDENMYSKAVKYLKTRFYKNQIEWCFITKYNNCKYQEEQRLDAINSVLAYNWNDYESYKMYTQLEFKNETRDVKIQKSRVISKLLNLKDISSQEKEKLKKLAIDTIQEMLNQDLVFWPKEAYIWKSNYWSRLQSTARFLEIISLLWLENFKDIESITDNINRRIISQKKNWSFGSTQDNILVIRAITAYLENSWELKDVNMSVKLKINSSTIDSKAINNQNKFDVFTKSLNLNSMKAENTFNVEKNWNGNIYYDLNLSYYLPSVDLKARDEWFYIEKTYYLYDEFKKIQSLKQKEMQEFYNYKISFDQLKYPKNIISYLTPIKTPKVWDLLVVYNKIITPEARDQVSFEWFVPAGSELVNPNLDTSTKIDTQNYSQNYDYEYSDYSYGYWYWYNNSNDYQVSYSDDISMLWAWIFDKTEFRADRFFGFANVLDPWIYELVYLIRVTHNWTFNIKPTIISEFYNPEVFGRSKWEVMEITD